VTCRPKCPLPPAPSAQPQSWCKVYNAPHQIYKLNSTIHKRSTYIVLALLGVRKA
jgi:hypothetical protein